MYNPLLGRAGVESVIGHVTRDSKLKRREKPASSVSDLEDRCLRLFDALSDLYELLEEYAPPWYTEQHHDRAAAALELLKSSAQPLQGEGPGLRYLDPPGGQTLSDAR